ncbi:Nn.00g089690.m01.CDS01 [Neocucurbitaria sp. VM-36]
MVGNLATHIKVSEEAVRPNLPQLCLELSASKTLSLTLPYAIQFAIKRQDGPAGKPVIFEWSPYIHGFAKSGFVLLHRTATNLEAITIDHSGLVDISRHEPLVVNGYNHDLWELAPGGSVIFQQTLPERFQKSLKPDETYTLLWPGSNIATWEYGTVREHINQEIKDKDRSLVLPGGPHVSFSVHTESQPWPMRLEREARVGFGMANLEEQDWRRRQNTTNTFPPAKPIDRDPDAPNLSVLLECSSTFRQDILFDVTVKVTYQAEPTAQAIIFHTRLFEDSDYYQLGRLCNGIWENYDDEESRGCGFLLVDSPDVAVNVGQSDHFASLQPGETWTTSQRLGYNWEELPNDAKNGEVFRYIFTGGSMDWWNWGSKADHEKTVVKLPCFIFGPVVDPKDNDGRPRLGVTSSNVVEFSFMD